MTFSTATTATTACDFFGWMNGDAGTIALPAMDVIKDFGMGGSDPNGQDVLDLRDLLQGEEYSSDLTHYLNFSFDGTNTILNVSSTGDLQTLGWNQTITLEGVDLIDGLTDQNQIINKLIMDAKLMVDQ